MIPYDNRSPRDYVKTPLAAMCGVDRIGTGKSHFRFSVNGTSIGYCYIRKNACSAFKKLMVDFSEYRHLCPRDGNPIDFLIRHHEENALRALSQCDALIFVYRDPIRRLTSLFMNKFIVRSGHEDIFSDFGLVTGRDPSTASFRDFVYIYLAHDPMTLDPHVWPQHAHLHPIRYSDPIHIDDLHHRMGTILGRELSDRYFSSPTNASVGRYDQTGTDLSDCPAVILRDAYLDKGLLPIHQQLTPPGLADRIAKIYAEDLDLIARLTETRT